MTLMYDSVEPSQIPTIKQRPGIMVAGYVDGPFAWPPQVWGNWPRESEVHITVTGNPEFADVYDVENGAGSLRDLPAFLDGRTRMGKRGTLYTFLANVDAAARVLEGRKGVDLWVADWNDNTIPPQVPGVFHLVAKQYQNLPTVDLSIVYDEYWPWKAPKKNLP